MVYNYHAKNLKNHKNDFQDMTEMVKARPFDPKKMLNMR